MNAAMPIIFITPFRHKYEEEEKPPKDEDLLASNKNWVPSDPTRQMNGQPNF